MFNMREKHSYLNVFCFPLRKDYCYGEYIELP